MQIEYIQNAVRRIQFHLVSTFCNNKIDQKDKRFLFNLVDDDVLMLMMATPTAAVAQAAHEAPSKSDSIVITLPFDEFVGTARPMADQTPERTDPAPRPIATTPFFPNELTLHGRHL